MKQGMPASVTNYLVASLVAHVGGLAVLLALGQWLQRPQPVQQVIVTKLVRLGPQRPKEALPQLQAAAKTAPVNKKQETKTKTSGPDKPPPVPAAATDAAAQAQARAQIRSQAQSALAKLKREAAGALDGDIAGDTDQAQDGDRYLAEVQRCLHDHYEIQALDSGQTRGLHALVVVRIQADGRIFDHRIAQSSGVGAFDQAVSRAVLGCSRVAPPPAYLQREARSDGIGIDFTP